MLLNAVLVVTSLTLHSYDGEADDPAPPVKEDPVKSEPEPAPVQTEPQEDAWEPEQLKGDTQFNAEPDQGGSHDVRVEPQDHDDDYDRPIGIKEDGYV